MKALIAKEIRLLKSIESFEKFCETGAIPDSAPETPGTPAPSWVTVPESDAVVEVCAKATPAVRQSSATKSFFSMSSSPSKRRKEERGHPQTGRT